MKMACAVASATLALMVLGGCGEQTGSDPAVTPEPSTQDPQVAAIEHPGGPDEVVLSIETGGGFVPVEYAVTNQPTLLLTGDGRLFRQPDTGRQHRLIAMTVAELDEDQVQQLLALASGAGLLAAPPDYTDTSGPQVSDAPTTVVTLAAGGGTWRHEVYALGYEEDQQQRIALGDFIDATLALVEGVAAEPFVPSDLALYVQPTDLARDVSRWPDPTVDLSRIDGCQAVAAGDLVDLLSSTSMSATFEHEGALYSVSAAEVLPGDTSCT